MNLPGMMSVYSGVRGNDKENEMTSIELKSNLTGKTKKVAIGDTVYCRMHGHNARIEKIHGNHVELRTTDGEKVLPDYSHIAHLTCY